MKELCLVLRYSQLSSTCAPRELESLPFWMVWERMPHELHVHLKVVFCGVGSTELDTHTLINGVSPLLAHGVIRLECWKQRSSFQSLKWWCVQFMVQNGLFSRRTEFLPSRR